MAGSRLLAQIALLLATAVLMLVAFWTMRLYRYCYSPLHPPIVPILTLEDWRRFLPPPLVAVAISTDDISQSTLPFQLKEESCNKYLNQEGLYHLSLSSERNFFSDSEAKSLQSIGNTSATQLIEDFWSDVAEISQWVETIPPSRSLHLNLILGAESQNIPWQSQRIFHQVALKVKDRFKSLHRSLPVSVSLRVMRNLQLRPFLKGPTGPSAPSWSVLSSQHLSSSSLLSKVSSVGIVGTETDGLSCDPQTELCTPFSFLIYLPEPSDQPVALTDSTHPLNSTALSGTKSLIFPSQRIGVLAFNDRCVEGEDKCEGEGETPLTQQRLAQQIVDQFTAHFAYNLTRPPAERPFDPTSSLWSRRTLLVAWSSMLYSDTLRQLTALHLLHSNSGVMSLPIDSGNYLPLDDERRRALVDLQEGLLSLFERCNTASEELAFSFDHRLSCAFREISRANLLARQVLSDPSLVHQRREGIEMTSALLLPYWFPLLIPLLYGTFFEIRRYFQKTKRTSSEGRAGPSHCPLEVSSRSISGG
jgi:hypothetical protein